MISMIDNYLSRLMTWLRYDPRFGYEYRSWAYNTHQFVLGVFSWIETKYLNMKYGIENLIVWIPVIWEDRDWDYAYLCRINELKLRRMAEIFKNGYHTDSNKRYREILICSEIMKRLADDSDKNYKRPYDRAEFFGGKRDYRLDMKIDRDNSDLLGKIIGSKIRYWWE